MGGGERGEGSLALTFGIILILTSLERGFCLLSSLRARESSQAVSGAELSWWTGGWWDIKTKTKYKELDIAWVFGVECTVQCWCWWVT